MIIRIDAEDGHENELLGGEEIRAMEILRDHYTSPELLEAALAKGDTMCCTFASYRRP